MNAGGQKTGSIFDQKEADQIARLFNVGFNSALLYGGDHPTTSRNIEPLLSQLTKTLQIIPMISLIVDRDSLYIEDFCTDKAVNPKRLIIQLSRIGIKSISFEKGVSMQGLQVLLKLAGDQKAQTQADQIQKILQNNGAGVRLNYIRLGKITTDQTLVNRDEEMVTTGVPQQKSGQLSQGALEEIEKILSLARLIEQPQEISEKLSKSIGTQDGAVQVARTIAQMRTEVQEAEPQSIESLLNAVFELKLDLSEALAVQKMTGKILSAADPVQKQMDNLTCDVLMKLIKEEYAQGELPVRRLAQIIRRMLPDISELKRVLPLLKTTLLKEGMSLSDYLQLVKMLDLEVQSEQLATLLNDAASGIGVSVDDVVKAIRTEPNDAARLMFLAAEIRQGTKQDDVLLSNMLTEYIEKVSTSFALDTNGLEGPKGGQVLGKILSQVEGQLLEKLKKYGIDEPVLAKVKAQLDMRFSSTFDTAAAQWMVNAVSSEQSNEVGDLSAKLAAFIGQDTMLSRLRDPLVDALASRGFAKERIEGFISRLAEHISSGKKIVLPSTALSSNNMLFLLNREIKQHIRYDTPFSTLLISIDTIAQSDGLRKKPGNEETSELLPKLFVIVKQMLRDIDLIGSLGGEDEHAVFVLLTMTAIEGARVVQERVIEKIRSKEFKYGNTSLRIDPVVSVTVPDKNVTRDSKSYLEIARKNHKRD